MWNKIAGKWVYIPWQSQKTKAQSWSAIAANIRICDTQAIPWLHLLQTFVRLTGIDHYDHAVRLLFVLAISCRIVSFSKWCNHVNEQRLDQGFFEFWRELLVQIIHTVVGHFRTLFVLLLRAKNTSDKCLCLSFVRGRLSNCIYKIIGCNLQLTAFHEYSFASYCLFMATIVILENKDLTPERSSFEP